MAQTRKESTMRLRNRTCAFTLATVCATALLVWADNEVPLKKAPAGVQATIKKVVGKNKFDSLDSDVENGKTVYEVDAHGKNISYSVHMSDSGEVLGISLDIPMEIVPAAVIDAAAKAHAGAKPTEPEIRTVNGQMSYKLELMVGKEKHEMLVDAAGKVISDETETEGADDVNKP
jgi:uncharacterized membrane protein YkoI